MSQPSAVSWFVTRLEQGFILKLLLSDDDLPELHVPHPEQLGQLSLVAVGVVTGVAAHILFLGGRVVH